MSVALIIRTFILAGWLLAVLWYGIREPLGIALALTLVAVWAVALVRDRLRTAPARPAAALVRPAGGDGWTTRA